ncbi:hypothetical protein [Siminovitchia sp. 179-K 8D1 HS]|uniref:hypothetical protein n=1 Tax=Siminovitchia sp. 179-K 8D1 HS TaxID=3142385 RepID=UPI0039A250D5
MKDKENVILIASAPKEYGKKVVTNRLNKMKRDRANLKNKLSNIKTSSRHVN